VRAAGGRLPVGSGAAAGRTRTYCRYAGISVRRRSAPAIKRGRVGYHVLTTRLLYATPSAASTTQDSH
jgi:hypothetical protein